MTLTSTIHPVDEDLALFADDLQPPVASSRIAAHLAICISCRTTVEEGRRGLAILARATEPPADLKRLATARRWAASHGRPGFNAEDDFAEDLREVAGRDVESGRPHGLTEAEEAPEQGA